MNEVSGRVATETFLIKFLLEVVRNDPGKGYASLAASMFIFNHEGHEEPFEPHEWLE